MTRTGLLALEASLEAPLGTPCKAMVPPRVPKFDPAHDRHLITETLAGNRAAFAALMRPYLNVFTSGIQRILQDGPATQDTLEEALLSIHAELPRFLGRTRFSTWAYRICLNEALLLRRSRHRQSEPSSAALLPL